MKKGNGYANVLFESNHTDAFNGKACGVTVVRSAHLPGSEKLAEKMIDAIVKVMKPSTGITYNRGVVTKTQSNGADWYGVIRGAVPDVPPLGSRGRGRLDAAATAQISRLPRALAGRGQVLRPARRGLRQARIPIIVLAERISRRGKPPRKRAS